LLTKCNGRIKVYIAKKKYFLIDEFNAGSIGCFFTNQVVYAVNFGILGEATMQ
jgi:hypothetical protein